jgi:hypothetical protein
MLRGDTDVAISYLFKAVVGFDDARMIREEQAFKTPLPMSVSPEC